MLGGGHCVRFYTSGDVRPACGISLNIRLSHQGPIPSKDTPFLLCLHTVSIYRCATATLPLRNSKITVGQQQPCRCVAVNNIVMSEQGKRIIGHEKKKRRKLSSSSNCPITPDNENRTQCPPLKHCHPA